ncbi:phage head closure protein [uncultured Methanobrevibacter sp.]|uniref:phage head closure protein n=1 Tax=uncultured Methanobrevibacter sp. TaxID=253161 RepID=UPI002623E854|nr:phage head closure protein [uncultured Methanobrevibacter sp.]
MMIDAGKYRYKITIIKETKTKDADGFIHDEPVVVLQPYAEVKTTRGMTLIANGSDFEKAFTRFVFRFPVTPIDRKMFVLFREKKYSIEYINNIDEANIEMELQCKEVTH